MQLLTRNLKKAYTYKVYQDYLKSYLRCVKEVDDNVKRLIDYLESEGILENTIIVYTRDQGLMLGELDYTDKRWMHEESMRIPFFVQFPKSIKPESRTDAIINNTDFAPTLIELARGKSPEYMQGNSFKTILKTGKESANWKKYTYYRYLMHMAHRLGNPAHFGIRTKKFMLIFFYGRYWVDTDDQNTKWNKESWGNNFDLHTPPGWELYDLEKDPHETNNVYGQKQYKEVINDMKKVLKEKREVLNETDKNYPHILKVIDEYWNQ